VTPLTLGIETLGSVMTPLISRNTTIPTSKSEAFTTAADSQTSVEVHVLQGERTMSSENKTIGRFSLDGIPPSPRGVPQIEVAFDIDANGILSVSAKDRATGKEQRITITASSGLAKDEVERLVHEAEAHADEDRQHRELIETRNQLDTLTYTAEKSLREHADKIGDDVKQEVEEKIAAARNALASDDTALMQAATEDLNASVTTIGEAVYQATGTEEGEAASTEDGQPSGPETPTETEEEKPEDTVEGEYREV